MKEKSIKGAKILGAGLISGLIFYIVFMRQGVSQDINTILTSDLNGQYVNYLLYFRNTILEHENIFYSFSGLLGINTMGLIGFYLMSPFNLFVFLYSAAEIGRAIYVIIILKVILASVTANIYFGRKNEYKLYNYFFACTYALSGYIFSYFMNIMWLDAVYMLPVVAIGIDRIIDKKKPALYIISLAYSVITCYYTGYMLAGFSIIYTAYLIFSRKQNIKEAASKWAVVFAGLLASVCISAVVLVPAAYAQFGSRGGAAGELSLIHSFTDILSALFTGVYDINTFLDGTPHIFCGLPVFFLVILYFMPHKEKRERRELIMAGIMLLIFVLSFMFGAFDIVWHMFTTTNSFTHRYAFIFVFILLIIASKSLEEINNVSFGSIILADLVLLCCWITVVYNGYDSANDALMIFDIISLLVISAMLCLTKVKFPVLLKSTAVVTVIVQITAIMINANIYAGVHTYDDHSVGGYYNAVKPAVDKMNEIDDGLYRVEKSFFNTNNDAMMLSYKGMSHFSSADKNRIKEFMGRMGYTKNYDFWAMYDRGATLAGDSLLGMKYYLCGGVDETFTEIDRVNDIGIYENEYALPLGIAGEAGIKNVKLNDDEPFVNQNNIFAALMGNDTNLFYSYDDISIKAYNLTDNSSDNKLIYERQSEGEAYISLNFVVNDNNPVYMYIPSDYNPGVKVFANGAERGEYLTTYHQGIIPLGVFEPESQVEIKILLDGNYIEFYRPQIATLNIENLKAVSAKLKENGWKVEQYGNNFIEAGIENEKAKTVFLSIPYDSGWTIKVDEKEVEPYMVCDALMAFDVEAGKHTIYMHYEGHGVVEGSVISVVGLLMFAVILLLTKRSRNKMH